MAVANNGTGVLVDSGGVTLAGFTNAAATNIKVQDGTIYTITSNSVGSNANGQILLAKSSGAVATLDSNHTFVCTNASVQSGLSADLPVPNMALSIRGAKLVFTGNVPASEITAPIVGNTETQVIYRAGGSTWNSAHPGVNIDGSTFIFQAGGDGHLGRHPNATVKNPKLIWTSTSPSDFVLGANQAWGADNKPSVMDGFTFQSILGNNLVSIFTWQRESLPGQLVNNYFFVCRDWTYNVAAVGTQPNAIRRSYRRTDATALAASYWGAVSICPTYLHIDLKTSLSASGVPDSPATYLRTVSYAEAGVAAGDKCVDVLSLRFAPTLVDPVGNRLDNTSIVVLNTNANCSASNAIGNFRARLAASGSTDSTGRFVITEPATKDYTSNASHRTDSIVIRNRTLTTAWHKWWEAGTKLIAIADSRNGTGNTAPESYAANEFTVSYRRAGSQFLSGALDMSAPQSPTVALSADANYNTAASTAGIIISYSAGVTTAALADGSHTLDSIWKAVIDFHAHPDRNEVETILPFTSWDSGVMRFGAALRITGSPAAIINAGVLVSTIASTESEAFNTPGNPSITAPYTDANNAGSISVTGVGVSDTAEMRKASDNSLIATRTGPGAFSVSPANVGVSVYFVRLVGSNIVMSTITTPATLTAGVNAEVAMFAGAEVQVAQAARIDLLPTLTDIEASSVLARKPDLQIINAGVKKASLSIPHTGNLP